MFNIFFHIHKFHDVHRIFRDGIDKNKLVKTENLTDKQKILPLDMKRRHRRKMSREDSIVFYSTLTFFPRGRTLICLALFTGNYFLPKEICCSNLSKVLSQCPSLTLPTWSGIRQTRLRLVCPSGQFTINGHSRSEFNKEGNQRFPIINYTLKLPPKSLRSCNGHILTFTVSMD